MRNAMAGAILVWLFIGFVVMCIELHRPGKANDILDSIGHPIGVPIICFIGMAVWPVVLRDIIKGR